MPKIKPYLIGALFGAGLTFVACRYHVVRHSDGVVLVPRSPQPPIRSAYVDIRDWGPSMWKQYPEVATALVSDGQGKLMAEKAPDSLKIELEDDVDDLEPSVTSKSRATNGVKSTSSGAKSSLTPIRLKTPTGESLDETSFGSRLKDDSEVGGAAAKRGNVDSASKALKSSLESLFAPYESEDGPSTTSKSSPATSDKAPMRRAAEDQSAGELALSGDASDATTPIAEADRTHVSAKPVSTQSEAPDRPLMELESLDIDLGEPIQLKPSTVLPRRAERGPEGGVSPVGQVDQNSSDIKSL